MLQLQMTSALQDGGGGSHGTTVGGSPAVADVNATAAAERAMQELLVRSALVFTRA